MWPKGPDSIRGCGPRNVRIAHFEDKLLELANEKKESIQLIPLRLDPEARRDEIKSQHALVICEGAQSYTRDHFAEKFGSADKLMYSLEGDHVQDVILGLRVKSDLPDPTAVLLTIAQNRFLLNSLKGDGFLNMRLTDEEVEEVFGIDLKSKEFRDCIQSSPCFMEYTEKPGEFKSTTHSILFLPAMLREGSPLWTRIQGGLKLFQIKEENLSAVTAFRLGMVHRPRFTAQLYPSTQKTPGTFGFLLGDAANAIHFWPGRGLNSGITSAISLARCLKLNWRDKGFREADFTRHEGLMAMLQYRHKSRAWRTMVTTDSNGNPCAIKNKIKQAIVESENGKFNKDADIAELMSRLSQIRSRLKQRISGLPGDNTLRQHLSELDPQTLRTLVVSGSWDTFNVGGEEVDVDLLFSDPDLPVPPERKQ
jgi:2-polyprenyl-6-methoxyphenol hydroxylase-like FAD-dependent oxidoreductase